jgi:adenine C2-methylase RlmN of 23S rRNA A2503 and tRNA A37
MTTRRPVHARQAGVLISRQAGYDSRCSMCDAMILGYGGSMSASELMSKEIETGRSHEQHPLDTLDTIVKVDGEWVHADCARDAGYEVGE